MTEENEQDLEHSGLLAAISEDADNELGEGEVEIDLSEAQDFGAFTADVVATVVSASIKKSKSAKNPGTQFIELSFKVSDDDEEYHGRRLWTNLWLRGSGAGFAKDKLIALGADINWDKPKIVCADLVGLTGILSVAPGDGNFAHKPEIKSIKAYDG